MTLVVGVSIMDARQTLLAVKRILGAVTMCMTDDDMFELKKGFCVGRNISEAEKLIDDTLQSIPCENSPEKNEED